MYCWHWLSQKSEEKNISVKGFSECMWRMLWVIWSTQSEKMKTNKYQSGLSSSATMNNWLYNLSYSLFHNIVTNTETFCLNPMEVLDDSQKHAKTARQCCRAPGEKVKRTNSKDSTWGVTDNDWKYIQLSGFGLLFLGCHYLTASVPGKISTRLVWQFYGDALPSLAWCKSSSFFS